MTTESRTLSIVGDGVSLRRIRPTVVTDLQSAISLTLSGNVQGTNATADHPSSTSSRSESSARLYRSLTFTEDDGRLAQFHGRSFEKTPARTHSRPKAAQSAVVLLCSGKNCLDTAGSLTTRNGFGTPSSDAEASGSGFSADPQVSIRRTSSIGQWKTSTQASDFVGGSRTSRSSWFDNDDAFDRPLQQRRSPAAAAATTARQHIYACQLPGSVKRSSRATSDLSNLMATLRENQNHSLSSTDRKSGLPDSEPSDSDIETVAAVQQHKLPSSGRAASPTGRFSGGRRPMVSAGRRSMPTMARGGFGSAQRQASSLSAADVEPLLCITSLELPTTHRSSGNARFAAAGDRTDKRVASGLAEFRQTLTPTAS